MALTCVAEFLGKTDAGNRPVRLVGLTISGFIGSGHTKETAQIGLDL